MILDFTRCRDLLNAFDFGRLFVEHIGWDRHGGELSVDVGGETYPLNGLAQKRGVQILECHAPDGDAIPDYNTRKKIEKQVTKAAYEHLIIFTDSARRVQIWQWVARAPGKPDAYRETTHHPGAQSGDLLLQKLQGIRFTLDEEESIDIAGASHRLCDAFDRDTVTKKFYGRFKDEQQAFLGFIAGITDQADRKWYASLMLNRLMFVWFIQEKGFLDGDRAYLQNRLARVRERKGKGKFHTFYRYFLLALFHEGFGKRKQDRNLDHDLTDLLGRIPYLNGGLFDPHKIEKDNDGIQIPDEAFERLFAFFGEYDWHLDTRTISQGNEINPDVLGYIFEKYINQKQMGAYYTKEDITEYISKNTILPFLFDAAKKKCKVAFQPGSALWRMLQEDPDAFIYPAMRKGVIDDDGNVIPLPPAIEKGVDTSKPNLLERRKGWNAKADDDYALPTEIWREHVARRQRCLDIREKLGNGEAHEVNDLITYNLDIRQFAERAISECEGTELLRAFWQSIRGVTVLDPTCGSGAFLFAALEILFPLYEACLTRMQGFVEDLDRSGKKHSPKTFSDFRNVLADIDRHPSRDYFILKSIIVHNLYGVDIMPEAVEICKLRLFLKLVAQVEHVDQLEPLPDIDFNIRTGNALVGFTSMEEIRKALSGDLIKQMELPEIEEQAEIAARAYATFHEMQTRQGMDSREFTEAKHTLRERLSALERRLNVYLASAEYGIETDKPKKFDAWVRSHQPFHWFVEFYGIMARGGFDVLIGNPPYIELSKLRDAYGINHYATEECGNLYCPMAERGLALGNGCSRTGMIVPLSLSSTERMRPLRDHFSHSRKCLWISHFSGDANPSKLFEGVKFRLDIFLACSSSAPKLYSSAYLKWFAEERPFLFPAISYQPVAEEERYLDLIPKTGAPLAASVLRKLIRRHPLCTSMAPRGNTVYVHRVITQYVKCFDFVPYFWSESDGVKKSDDYKPYYFPSPELANAATAVVNSTSFFLYFVLLGDCFHCGKEFVTRFPGGLDQMNSATVAALASSADTLMADMRAHAVRRQAISKRTGRIEYDEFWPRHSKPLLDEIDAALTKHYGFTDEELDFIINYDIKYRMGDALEISA